jgi:hypothetical protein
MTLLNFVTPLRIDIDEKGAWPVVAAYGKFQESALAEPKARRSFMVTHFITTGAGAQPTYRLETSITIEVLDSQLASIQAGVGDPQWASFLP